MSQSEVEITANLFVVSRRERNMCVVESDRRLSKRLTYVAGGNIASAHLCMIR